MQTSDIEVYKDVSDPSHFIAVNHATHDALHYALHLIFYNGMDAFHRYVKECEREAVLNNYADLNECVLYHKLKNEY